MRERLLRWWAYTRRGFTIYLAFGLSLLNFMVIQYKLLVEQSSLLSSLFPNIIVFAIVSVPLILATATLIGWWDFKRGSYPTDAFLMAYNNPWVRDFTRAWKLEKQGKTEEALKIIEKWTQDNDQQQKT